MQPPSDHHSFFCFCFLLFCFGFCLLDTAKQTLQCRNALQSPGMRWCSPCLTIIAYTHGIVKCYGFIRYYKHVMVQPLRDHQLGRRAPEWTVWCPCLTIIAYTHGIVKCYGFIRYYKHVMVQPLRDHQLGRRAPEWTVWQTRRMATHVWPTRN